MPPILQRLPTTPLYFGKEYLTPDDPFHISNLSLEHSATAGIT